MKAFWYDTLPKIYLETDLNSFERVDLLFEWVDF